MILSPQIAAVTAAKKIFYNLDLRRDKLLSSPPERDYGVWFVNGFVAGQCGSCGQIQYPQLSYCVSCRARADDFVQVPLAEEGARVLTYTADGLMYHPAPPLYVGFAALVSVSRVVIGAHYVSDVVAATFIAIASTYCLRRWLERKARGWARWS